MQNPTTGLKRVLGNLGVLLGGRAVNAPFSLLHTALAIRLLGGYGFGLIAMMYAFARTLGDVVDFQSWQVVLHYGLGPLTRKDTRAFHRILGFTLALDALSGLAGCIIGVTTSLCAMHLLGWPQSIHFIGAAYMLSVMFMTTATATGILRVLNRYDLISVQSTSATIVRLIGTLLLYTLHGTFIEMAAVWFLAEAVAWSLLYGFAWRELHQHGLTQNFWRNARSTIPDILSGKIRREFPGIWHFAITNNANSTLALAFGHVGTLIVGAMLGPASAGYYRIASQLAAGVAKPVTLIQTTLYPEMARMWQERTPGRLYKLSAQIALLAGAFGTILLIIALFAGKPLLTLIMGAASTHALPVMLWLLAAEIVTVWGLPLEPILFTTHKASAAILARSLQVAFFLPCLVLTIHWDGLNGVGPATLCSIIMLIALQLVFVLRTMTPDGTPTSQAEPAIGEPSVSS